MKRTLIIVVLLVFSFSSLGTAMGGSRPARGRRTVTPATGGKVAVRCPAKSKLTTRGIRACPNTGCGPSLDPLLNKQKNIRSDDQHAVRKTLQDLKDLPDPVAGYQIGDPRDKLTDLGEGNRISVVGLALVARKGSKESCNCRLSQPKNTDNHIVLVEESTLALTARASRARPATAKRKAVKARTARQNTLRVRELQSVTAEFTPRVRLDHPKLAGARLQALIEATPKKALLVRVTGLQMFDSQHSLEGHLKRVNNWEIHPVMKLEFCPQGKTCTADSNENWKDLE